MALLFGYKPPSNSSFDATELNNKIGTNSQKIKIHESHLNDTVNKNCQRYCQLTEFDTYIFKKDGSVQMNGDIDMGDNSIIGIDYITADNSVPSKKYVKDELGKKLSTSGGSMTGNLSLRDGLVVINGIINMADQKIRFLGTPTDSTDAATKKYVDDKITALAARVTSLEILPLKIYTYSLTYYGLGTSWSYPKSGTADGNPNNWMHCKGLTARSRFHLHHLFYDTDSSIPNNYIFTFELQFFTPGSNYYTHTLSSITKSTKAVPGENILYIGEKYSLTTVTNYSSVTMARLRLKGNSVKGNEITISCSFEI